MSVLRRIPNVIAGLLAGFVATMVMALLMATSRFWLGIMPPPEAIPDRVAPLLDIETFFSLFGKYGGYNGLKQFGILSGLRGLFGVGIVVGLIYALVVESRFSRRSPRWLLGTSRPALIFVGAAVLAIWLGLVVFLWPVLVANYRGLPPTFARIVTIVAMLLWYGAYAATLIVGYRFMTRRATPEAVEAEAGETAPAERPLARPLTRRGLLAGLAGGALIYPTYRLIDEMYRDATFTYDGTPYSGDDIEPIAPVDRFYVVTKNVVDPDPIRDIWRLEVGGHVEESTRYGFDDLMEFEQIDQETTLMCISNRIGSGLFSNANWRGVRMRDLLERAGVREGAVEVFLTGADAYKDSFPLEKAMEPSTLLVYEINGEPLPRRHGFPVRVIVPGLFGEKNIKWVTRIEVVDHDAQGFYEQQGWGPNFVVPTRSDIFAPRAVSGRGGFVFRDGLQSGQEVEIRGRAFAGSRGVRSVEVTTDDGATWQPAELYYPGTELTWTLWRHRWTPAQAGEFVVTSRATDGTGALQSDETRGIVPQGAQGFHRVTATVG
ncbi:MAG: molybdopterin-dependent oxidoreductase [Chloroflexia bacterium]|nr:molybdopterin-dependent oxidoreductase [Chloroflexia bacterium]